MDQWLVQKDVTYILWNGVTVSMTSQLTWDRHGFLGYISSNTLNKREILGCGQRRWA